MTNDGGGHYEWPYELFGITPIGCEVKNTFGIFVCPAEYTFPILLFIQVLTTNPRHLWGLHS